MLLKDATKLFLGTVAVKAVMLGSAKVWPPVVEPEPDPGDPFAGLLKENPSFVWPRLSVHMVGPDVLCFQAVLGSYTPGSLVPFTGQTGDVKRKVGAGAAWWRTYDTFTDDSLRPAFQHAGVADDVTPKPAADVDTASRWSVTSSNHAGFGTQVPTQISRLSANLREVCIDLFPNNSECIMRHRVYLKIGTAVQEGKSYTVTFTHQSNAALNFSKTFTFSKDNWSEAIHVSQEGYHPKETVKQAFVSIWLGAHPTAIITPYLTYTGLAWELVKHSDNTVVANGTLQPDADLTAAHQYGTDGTHLSSTPSWKADFSAYTTVGTYRLRIAGIGSSYPFTFNEEKWDRLAVMTTRGATIMASASRDKVQPYVSPEYVKPRQHRPAGTVINETDARIEMTSMGPFTGNNSTAKPYPQHPDTFAYLTSAAVQTGRNIGGSVQGGWDDAADWDCRVQAYTLAAALLDAYEMSIDYWKQRKLYTDNPRGIPTNVPDILREVHNLVEFFRQLQVARNDTSVPNGLGVPGGVEYNEHPDNGCTSYATARVVYSWGSSIFGSYSHAGVAAQLAYCLDELTPKPTALVTQLRTSAEKAWVYAEGCSYSVTANGVTKTAAEVRADTECQRLRAEALGHLYRLTGTASYNTAFINVATTSHYRAAWLYSGPRWPTSVSKDATKSTALKNGLTSKANGLIGTTRGGFGIISDGTAKPQYSNNSPSVPGECSRIVCYAHNVAGTGSYIDAMCKETLWGLGANPLNLCCIGRMGIEWPETPTEVDYWMMGKHTTPGRVFFMVDTRGAMTAGNLFHFRDRIWPRYWQNWAFMNMFQNWHGSLASVHEFGQDHLRHWPVVASYLAARLGSTLPNPAIWRTGPVTGLPFWLGNFGGTQNIIDLMAGTTPGTNGGLDLVLTYDAPQKNNNVYVANTVSGFTSGSHHTWLVQNKARGLVWTFHPWYGGDAYVAPTAWPADDTMISGTYAMCPIKPPTYTGSETDAEKRTKQLRVWQYGADGWMDDNWRARFVGIKRDYFNAFGFQNKVIVLRVAHELSLTGGWGGTGSPKANSCAYLTTSEDMQVVKKALERVNDIFIDVFNNVQTGITGDVAYPRDNLWCYFNPLSDSAMSIDVTNACPDNAQIAGPDYYDFFNPSQTQAQWNASSTAMQPPGRGGGPKGIVSWLNWAKSKNKLFGVGEWGVWNAPIDDNNVTTPHPNAGLDNPLFIRNMLKLFKDEAVNVAFVCYFNRDMVAHADWPSHLIKSWTGIDDTAVACARTPSGDNNQCAAREFRKWMSEQ